MNHGEILQQLCAVPKVLRVFGLQHKKLKIIFCFKKFFQVPRSESVQDVTGNYRPYDRHRPLWLSEKYERPLRYRNPAPYKFERNKQMAEHYWRDQYYFTSPLYNRTSIPHRPFQSEYGSHIYTYWARYNGYGYDRNHPAFYRRYFNPFDDYFG